MLYLIVYPLTKVNNKQTVIMDLSIGSKRQISSKEEELKIPSGRFPGS